jgi:hypothetical protein
MTNQEGPSANKTWSTISVPAGSVTFPCLPPGRRIRLLGEDVAIVHGSEEDEIEQGGKRSLIRYIHPDIVMRRDGTWQIVASQLARPVEDQAERW